MKVVYLILSILWTTVIFYFSTQSGFESAVLSEGITSQIYSLFEGLFVWLQINLEMLHIIIRKTAHIAEYFILGVLYTKTGFQWNLKIVLIIFAGLFIACTDEFIQIFSFERGPSIIDVLLFDYVGYFIGFLVAIRIFHLPWRKINE